MKAVQFGHSGPGGHLVMLHAVMEPGQGPGPVKEMGVQVGP